MRAALRCIPVQRTSLLRRDGCWQSRLRLTRHLRFAFAGCQIRYQSHAVHQEELQKQTPLKVRVLKALELQTHSDEEIAAAFDRVDLNGNGVLEPDEVRHLLGNVEIDELCTCLGIERSAEGISKAAFVQGVAALADTVDPRIYTISLSLMLTGFSIGIFGPALPVLIKDLGMTTAQTGLLTTGFGVAKLLGNIPFGIAADKYGRRPVIVFGCGALAAGMLAVSLGPVLSTWEPVLLARCINGAGAAALITGAFVAAADISTPRTRTRTMAPINAGFNFGNAFGPLVGGVLIASVGVIPTFVSCSAVMGVNMLGSLWIRETRPALAGTSLGFLEAYKASTASWSKLLKRRQLLQATIYQAVFWLSFGAGFMTCVPIILGYEKFGLAATSLGLVYGSIAAVNVAAAQPLALMTDRMGKLPAMVGGVGLMGMSLGGLPLCADVSSLSVALGGWAISSTLLFNLPQAIAADATNEQERSTALAMVRTLGDVGLVFGGVGASLLGTVCSTDVILGAIGSTCLLTAASTLGRSLKAGPHDRC